MLKRLEIKGYKSIKHCDIELKKVNVLIGSNGSGKSNLISAFSFLNEITTMNLQVAVGQASRNTLLYKGIKETQEIIFALYLPNNSEYGFTLVPTVDNRLIFKEEYVGTENYERHILASGNSESHWDKSSDLFHLLDKYCIWGVYHFHDTGSLSLIKQEHSIANSLLLLDDGRNLAAFLYRLKKEFPINYKQIVRCVQLVAPYFADFVLEPQPANPEYIQLRWQEKNCSDVFFASQLSDGTLRFICLATLLLQAEKLMPSTILIDEPELGLHPFAIHILAELVQNLPENKQVILSTQSPTLIDAFSPEDIIVAERGQEGSQFRRLHPEDLALWLEDYSLGELWQKNILGGRPQYE